ncbi:hypothetical protein RvY_18018 [Ramazzottius varieornatus]|uniref:Glycosyl transferase CAP10 domain-containing protein n=1 Tax=Ramazzottius varieornatus TaxID=947166 RepID=A0A1D1W646_RAMVA|nr:hypothetical protein RvY_18018 [Ramazzottius varieornatus]
MFHCEITGCWARAILCMFVRRCVGDEPTEASHLSLAWGPGLSPASLVLPVRYFFIQAIDAAGNNCTLSPGKASFVLKIEALKGRCGIHAELLDRKDGTFVARYRTYDTCHGLRISVHLKNGQHILHSPWISEEDIVNSDCECPVSLEEWKTAASCPESFPQIDKDLQDLENRKLNVTEAFQALASRYHPQSASFCHYVIRDVRLYRKCYGEHVGFAMFMDQTLLFLLRRTALPSTEFIVNLGDYPLTSRKSGSGSSEQKQPVFSWCGNVQSFDIVMPTYDITESSLHAMNRVTLDMLSVQATDTPVWDEKQTKAFWRGRDARMERLRLVELSRAHPDLIDAALTNFFFFRDKEESHGPPGNRVDFFQFFQSKYQLNLDGTVAAYRFPYLLAGDSLVFKQDSQYYEHFYNDLQPGVHYIPVKRDLSDLEEKLEWAKTHDEEARVIAKRGSDYARNNLLPHNIFCYYTLLIEKWSRSVSSPPSVVPKRFTEIAQPATMLTCPCQQDFKADTSGLSATKEIKDELCRLI